MCWRAGRSCSRSTTSRTRHALYCVVLCCCCAALLYFRCVSFSLSLLLFRRQRRPSPQSLTSFRVAPSGLFFFSPQNYREPLTVALSRDGAETCGHPSHGHTPLLFPHQSNQKCPPLIHLSVSTPLPPPFLALATVSVPVEEISTDGILPAQSSPHHRQVDRRARRRGGRVRGPRVRESAQGAARIYPLGILY